MKFLWVTVVLLFSISAFVLIFLIGHAFATEIEHKRVISYTSYSAPNSYVVQKRVTYYPFVTVVEYAPYGYSPTYIYPQGYKGPLAFAWNRRPYSWKRSYVHKNRNHQHHHQQNRPLVVVKR